MRDIDRVVMVNKHILVKQEKKADRTESGLYISTENPMLDKYTVVSVAEGVTIVKPGDQCIIDNVAVSKRKIDDEEYFAAEAEDIILVFKAIPTETITIGGTSTVTITDKRVPFTFTDNTGRR